MGGNNGKKSRPVSQHKNTQSGAIYQLIRDDIIQGRLAANSRLKVSALADTYGTSTNPIREALQQLRGEGFVLMEPNRGARVRPIDDNFIRDVIELESLIEPYLAKAFVELATSNDIMKLEELHEEIAELDFLDPIIFTELDTRFHSMFYSKHYNHHTVELWRVHREILSAFSRHVPIAKWRREAVVTEHAKLVDSVKRHDVEGAAEIVNLHIQGAGKHLIEQLRAATPIHTLKQVDERQ
jgi:DNA-binding GntR family transcriptional regulator